MRNKKGSKIFSFITVMLMAVTYFAAPSGYRAYAAAPSPKILITEVMPMSKSGSDLYEFIEVYNNSDDGINIRDYKLPLQHVDFTSSKTIPPRGILVICTRSETTLDEFNEFYGTSLTSDKYMKLSLQDDIFDNDSDESIMISKDDNMVIIEADYRERDVEAKESIQYKYPESGYEMEKIGVKRTPTPGSVKSSQVPDYEGDVTGITLSRDKITMGVNQTAVLRAAVTPSDASDKSVLWTSDDPEVVEVDERGVLTSKKVGDAVITAETVDGGYKDSCLVTVRDEVEDDEEINGFRLNKSQLYLKVGKSHKIVPLFSPGGVKGMKITWESDDEDIAMVTSNGLVMGLEEGCAKITATVSAEYGEYSDTCIVYVRKHDNGKSKWNDTKKVKEKGYKK